MYFSVLKYKCTKIQSFSIQIKYFSTNKVLCILVAILAGLQYNGGPSALCSDPVTREFSSCEVWED